MAVSNSLDRQHQSAIVKHLLDITRHLMRLIHRVTMPKAKKIKKYPQKRNMKESTDPLRCVGGRVIGASLGFERVGFQPLTRMAVPSVQEALQCVRRMKAKLGLSVVDLAAVMGISRSVVANWHSGRMSVPVTARLLIPRLERELLGPQDDLAELFPPPTGSVQPAQDVILPSKPGHQA